MYKYCIVPKCTNTTIKTPEKLFFNVPKDPKLRKKWYATVKRDDKIPPSARTARYCCEDHFDVSTYITIPTYYLVVMEINYLVPTITCSVLKYSLILSLLY